KTDFRYLSDKRPKYGEGRPAANEPIVPIDPKPSHIYWLFPKISEPTRRIIIGNIKNGISTQQCMTIREISRILGDIV
ncbi:MAG: hypothetical protein ACFFD2_24220, partial [Promethearchaeota archaeon]